MHTRISDDLDEALQDAARRLRLPVSNLVRNVLEDVVEEATDLGRRWEGRFRERTAEARARRVEVDRDETPPAPPKPPAPEPAARAEFPDVAAWQPLVMNTVHECAGCGRSLRRGDKAYLAVGGSRPGPTFLCESCLDGLG